MRECILINDGVETSFNAVMATQVIFQGFDNAS